MKIRLTLFLLLLLNSCSRPLLTFTVEDQERKKELRLFSDSTFKERIWYNKEKTKYSGKWTGSIKEDSVFTTTATSSGFQILTITPQTTYKVIKGKAIIYRIGL